MDAAILGSQDYLHGRIRHETLTLASSFNPRLRNSEKHTNPTTRFSDSRRRKPRSVGLQSNSENFNHHNRSHTGSMVARLPAKNLVMGEVKILKRGESFAKTDKRVSKENRKPMVKLEKNADLVLGSTDRLGPDPETVQKQIRVDDFNKLVEGMYAGSAFVASPPPSSLPVPGFLGKSSNGAATNDLRRLLRLDVV
ncbi:uncharacterized protein LOC110617791 [Manihot esculenta]|uniref:Uncharacterized protein n=1 Tax=Manihot esculenta TaxID=3983 RepID=A0A2C9VMS1_MANES|nr:uncharacterized protein LOC110617791 [Manihot esculenta]OAY46955.1 hypothetical protein MANES_06G040800v8 [Manihot esculenta]